jgi:CMP/dCMP kinase
MIIAIDGPAGSGKSSTARAVARRLGFRHLDSGAFYRALTHAALAAGLPAESWHALTAAQLDAFDVRATPAGEGFAFAVAGRAVEAELRTPTVNAHVSRMAAVPAVRHWLLDQLRAAAPDSDLVVDGRDIGTVVFPDAELKIFLVADPAERARRRLAEQRDGTLTVSEIEAEVERLAARDRTDSERDVAPLRRADDAVVIDTSRLAFDTQVTRIVDLIEERRRGASARRFE